MFKISQSIHTTKRNFKQLIHFFTILFGSDQETFWFLAKGLWTLIHKIQWTSVVQKLTLVVYHEINCSNSRHFSAFCNSWIAVFQNQLNKYYYFTTSLTCRTVSEHWAPWKKTSTKPSDLLDATLWNLCKNWFQRQK